MTTRDMHDHDGALATARAQKLMISARQLKECGFSRSAIRHRIRRGLFEEIFPGVYAVGFSEVTPDREASAAVLAYGDGAALSITSAATHLRVREGLWPIPHHVSVPGRIELLELPRICLHRPRDLRPEHVFEFEGIRTTTLERTIYDCAGFYRERALRAMIRHAQREHALELASLHAFVEGHSAKSFRAQRVRRALARYVPTSALTDSERESLFLDLCARIGLPTPLTQQWIAGYRVDFLWEELRLIVELDDRQSHAIAVAFTEDRIRDRALRLAGYTVIRFTVAELRNQPQSLARELGQIIRHLEHERGAA